MSDEQQKKEMLARANMAVGGVAKEFVGNLNDRVVALEKAIRQNDRAGVIEKAYNLETEAATFGWPRVTRICKWLRKVFAGDVDQMPSAEDILKTLNALKLMVCDPGNPDPARDEALFRELYPVLKKAVNDI